MQLYTTPLQVPGEVRKCAITITGPDSADTRARPVDGSIFAQARSKV